MNVFTAGEMRECDRRAMENYGIPGICLMEASGVALTNACVEELGGELRGKTITILCGKGNNGGDGFVAARHLMARGAVTRLFLFGITDGDLLGDAAAHFLPLRKLLLDQGVPMTTVADISRHDNKLFALAEALHLSSLVLDCVYGTGFRPPLPPVLLLASKIVRDSGVRVVSCDIPSGIDADTGADGDGVGSDIGAFAAHRTVALAGLKRGLLFYPGATYAGGVSVAPIGIPAAVLDQSATATLTTREWVRTKLPPRAQSRDANKGRFGTVLVVAGSGGMAGAAVLAALSALRGGAGLVHLALPASVVDTAAILAPELVLHALPETLERSHGGDGGLEQVLTLARKADAVAVGPGMGGNPVTVSFVRTFIQQLPAQTPLVLDADGLNAVADAGSVLFIDRSSTNTVLTPHPGEAARLLGSDARIIQQDRAGATRDVARLYRATVLLKGTRTLIATEGNANHLYINRRGSVALATAGSGDVLTGLIAALLADRENTLSATDAARSGAFLHALAGEWCEKERGAVGVVATEIRDALPEARRSLYDIRISEGSNYE